MKPRCYLLVATIAVLFVETPTYLRADEKSQRPLKPGGHIELIYGPRYLTAHGWSLPYPPYPEKARLNREQGRVYLHVITDKTGQVTNTSVLRTPLNTSSKTLRQLVVLWSLYKWHGPPNVNTNVEFEFRLTR